MLRGAPYVVELVARDRCKYLCDDWEVVLIRPFVRLLAYDDDLPIVVRVGVTVGTCRGECRPVHVGSAACVSLGSLTASRAP